MRTKSHLFLVFLVFVPFSVAIASDQPIDLSTAGNKTVRDIWEDLDGGGYSEWFAAEQQSFEGVPFALSENVVRVAPGGTLEIDPPEPMLAQGIAILAAGQWTNGAGCG